MAAIFKVFIRILQRARLCTLELTHTIQLPAVAFEINDELPTGWLRECVQRLPNLQSLIVSGVRVFDYASVKAIHSSQPTSDRQYGLRLLDASACVNAIPTALTDAICAFPNLVYLNLSETRGAKDHRVLAQLKMMQNLRVLKLARLHLQDAEMEVIAVSIGHRVRSLDLRDNGLTNVGAELLATKCFKDFPELSEQVGEDGHDYFFEVEDLEGHVRTKLTRSMVGRLSVENRLGDGVTHLYISGNRLTIKGIAALLKPGRLNLLDVGEMPFYPSQNSSGRYDGDDARLVSRLERAKGLKHLRISHEILTLLEYAEASLHLHAPTGVGPANPEHDTTRDTKISDVVEASGSTSNSSEKYPKWRLHPLVLSKLRTLTLTGIASHTTNATIAQRLVEFTKFCCQQSTHAAQQAEETYALPPGRSRVVAKREYALSLFPLERINLEIEQITLTTGSTVTMLEQKPSSSWWQHPTLSTTDDRDSDAFWEAARNDFSFFEDEQDADDAARAASQGRVGPSDDVPMASEPAVDVVREIASSAAGTPRSRHFDIRYIVKGMRLLGERII